MDFSEQSSTFIETQLASITTFNIRFSHYIMNIDENLHSIFIIIEEPREELEFTAAQREKRIRAEFARRFTRDYLYPIRLKMNELENEYVSFLSSESCKVTQSTILRTLVLVLLKKLSNSTQVYLQFMRKTQTKIFVKLKEVLHLISHFLEIIRKIVDHRILRNNDIEKQCLAIMTNINNEKQNFKPDKTIERQEKIQKSNESGMNVNKSILKKSVGQKNIKNKVHFTSENETEKLDQSEQIHHGAFPNCDCSKTALEMHENEPCANLNSIESDGNHPILHDSISNLCSKISDLIINELVAQVVEEMNECFRSLAFDAFELEFKS
ncbi:uncharacterized protein LOC135850149 [Planococcus citri]|uniref:uncharacterized protein LOC135850149 n=1 Tax=Planococcus citri TaxID=170843 RepID=UPI0031F818A3